MLDERDKFLLLSSVKWSKLQNKTILLTGASGFLGKWFIESFLLAATEFNLNAKLICLVRDKNKLSKYLNNTNILVYECDITKSVFGLAKDVDYIIHAACPADNRFAKERPLDLLDICYFGTKNLINSASEGRKKESFLYLSSGAVYGDGQLSIGEVTESYQGSLREPNFYREGKRMAELICQNSGLPVKIARIFSTFGPMMDLDSNFAVCSFIKNKLQNKPLKLSNKNIVRSYQYAADTIIWLWNILIDGKSKEVYNVGSDEPIVLEKLAKMISNNVEVVNDNFVSNSGNMYVPNINKAKSLGLKQNYSLEQSLAKTISHYQNVTAS